jgi:ankyrin repeat protein
MVRISCLARSYLSQAGKTALSNAAFRGRTATVKLLLEAGADKDARSNVRVADFI